MDMPTSCLKAGSWQLV